jgi:hypothetical protein
VHDAQAVGHCHAQLAHDGLPELQVGFDELEQHSVGHTAAAHAQPVALATHRGLTLTPPQVTAAGVAWVTWQ